MFGHVLQVFIAMNFTMLAFFGINGAIHAYKGRPAKVQDKMSFGTTLVALIVCGIWMAGLESIKDEDDQILYVRGIQTCLQWSNPHRFLPPHPYDGCIRTCFSSFH